MRRQGEELAGLRRRLGALSSVRAAARSSAGELGQMRARVTNLRTWVESELDMAREDIVDGLVRLQPQVRAAVEAAARSAAAVAAARREAERERARAGELEDRREVRRAWAEGALVAAQSLFGSHSLPRGGGRHCRSWREWHAHRHSSWKRMPSDVTRMRSA